MNREQKEPAAQDEPCSFWRSRYALGFIVIGAVAAYFLLTEHLAHVVGALPFLLLLACPLMHVFMHHGHHGQHGHGDPQPGENEEKTGTESVQKAKGNKGRTS